VKLGTLLLRDAVISLAQLEAGLRAQVLYGGKLGTNLVELDFIDVDTLGGYLGRVTGLPVATKALFEATPNDTIANFERDLAELYVAFPLGPDPQNPNALAVALVDASDAASVEQLASQVGCDIVPYIAPELRMYYYLERHFGLSRKARYVRSGTRQRTSTEDDRRRTQPPRGLEMPPAVRFVPKQNKADAGAKADAKPKPPRKRDEPRVALDDVIEAMATATGRNQIGDAIIEYAIGRFDAAVVFLLRDANALGWRVYTSRGSISQDEFEQLSLPLGGASALQAAHDSRAPYRGKAPTAGRPVESRLWKALHIDGDPRELLVVPVMLKARVVNLVYVHTETDEHIADELVDALTRIGHHASDAYTRLIQRAKTES
jgi:hypothetical protein